MTLRAQSGAMSGPKLAPGTRLGRYEILAPLGAGGMGEVWRARDSRLGREVAIKVLPRHLTADPAALQRFEREARAVAALSHPNILAIHDFERDGETLFAVTELLEGESLRDRLRNGPVAPRRVREWGAQIARALAAAHDCGIVHRDVKPDNLFLTNSGVKLLDFGVAQRQRPPDTVVGGESLHTMAGTVLGTVGYMAPEQLRGAGVDLRADVFALGCVLYELLTGERAFAGSSAGAAIGAILTRDPPRLASLGETAGPQLARIVRRCLEKQAEWRFQSAHDLALALEAETVGGVVSDVAATLSPGTLVAPQPRMPTWISRRRRALAIGLALAGVAAAALVLLLLGRRWAAPASGPKLRTLSYSGQDWSAAVSPDGRVLAFVSRRDGQPRIWLRALATGEEAALTSGPDEGPRFSPDGASLLFARHEQGTSSLYRIPVLGGEPRLVVPGASEGDWAPDGRRVCFIRRQSGRPGSVLGVAGVDGSGERLVLTRNDVRALVTPRWSPAGDRLAVVVSGALPGLPDELWVVDVDAGRGRALATLPGGLISAPAWLRGGGALLYAQAEQVSMFNPASRLVVQPARGGRPRVLLSYPQLTRVVDLLASGRVVVDAITRRARLREVAVRRDLLAVEPGSRASGEGRWLTRGDLIDRQPVYSPDGKLVVFSSSRSGNLDLWAIDRGTGALHRLTDDPATDWDPAFTADGRQLLWSSNRSGRFQVWIADADGQGPRQLSQDGFDAENPTVTPDGWVVYAGGPEQQGGLWKRRLDGSGWSRVQRHNLLNHPEVSPDGRLVAYHVTVPGGVEVGLVSVASGAAVGAPLLLRDSAVARSTVLAVNPTSIGRLRWQRDGRGLLVVTVDDAGRTGVSVAPLADGGDGLAGNLRPLAGFGDELQPESFGVAPDGSALTLSVPDYTMALMAVEGLEGISP
ncbi:MAG TPA: protein kinase [Thermoanaerobaculia bacterium]|nr:protein kinase [Thermoanaerobaculia bacterium]